MKCGILLYRCDRDYRGETNVTPLYRKKLKIIMYHEYFTQVKFLFVNK